MLQPKVEQTIISDSEMPAELTVEQLLDLREKYMTIKEVAESAISVYNDELMIRLDEEKVNGMMVGNKTVSKVVRVSFTDTTLAQAKELSAIKEVADNAVLKKLYDKGVPVPGVKVSKFISVREVQSGSEE